MAISLSSNSAQNLGQATTFNDLAALDNLRSAAQKDQDSALREVAQQFESIFMGMVLKGMRDANAAFESDLFNSNYTKFYRDMADEQMSLNMAQQGALGLADIMVQQLGPQSENFTPASVLRGDMSGEIAARQSTNAASNSQGMTLESVAQNSGHPASATEEVKSAKTVADESQEISFESPEDFVQKLMPMATKAAETLGVNPVAILAQAALETGWGQKIIRQMDGSSSFNLFNIKANSDWQGPKATVSTLEFEDGLPVKKMAAFRSYDNIQQSFDDYADFLSNSERYSSSLNKNNDSAGFLHELQKAGYATDPNYATKAISVLKKITGMNEL